jgi:hypothetical protein
VRPADVVEAEGGLDVELLGARVPGTVALEVHDDQQAAFGPHTQLARALAGIRLVGGPDLPDYARPGGVGDLHHEHAGVRVGAVGAAADVGVRAVDRERRVHAPVEKWVVAHQWQRA